MNETEVKALTIAQVCKILQVGRRSVETWIAEGRLRVTRVGPRSPRILAEDLSAFLEAARAEG